MRAESGITADYKAKDNTNLSVCVSEKRKGYFIIRPVGSINAITSQILQNEVKLIMDSKPGIILFDMKWVHYINSKGLRVFFKVHQVMKSRGGSAVLVNIQPHIKKVFEIIDALSDPPALFS